MPKAGKIDKKRAEYYAYIAALIIVVVLAAVFAYAYRYSSTTIDAGSGSQAELKSFANYDELKNYLKRSQESYGYGFGMAEERMMGTAALPAAQGAAADSGGAGKASDYSTTNIQVEGVDEADIVKNDGKYIYTITSNKVVIADAYPAENAAIKSVIDDGQPEEIFVDGDRLAVFGYETQEYYGYGKGEAIGMPSRMIAPDYYPYYSQKTFVHVYDITDRSSPVLVRNETFDGNYVDSRMIGDYVYFIVNAPVLFDNGNVVLPRFSGEAFPTIYYFPVPASNHVFTNIVSMNMMNDEPVKNKVFMLSYSGAIYVSRDSIYITYEKVPDPVYILEKTVNDVYVPVVPADVGNELKNIIASGDSYSEKNRRIYEKISEWSSGLGADERYAFEQQLQEKMSDFYNEVNKEYEKTVVQKIGISNGNIEYEKAGEFPGNVLNQFSMDEFNGYFRAATTTGQVSRSGETTSSNNIYVLDSEMNIAGSLEGLAPGERIYSARFIGNRAYLVTFKKVDPLFVIDMSNPAAPTVLGKLKIPGYSDYLHPYDENHIIGIGKEAVEAEGGSFAWYQGVKLSLFDVTDVENPVEVSKANIGDRGTDSYALYDHHAFLFDKAKHLLVIPITLAEINESRYSGAVPDNAYGDYVWQGAYVFDLTLDNGFVLKGRIAHDSADDAQKTGYYFNPAASIKRSLYIGDVLYTVSDKQIKANSLPDLAEIKTLGLPYEEQYYPVY